jgi:hypothetical protein
MSSSLLAYSIGMKAIPAGLTILKRRMLIPLDLAEWIQVYLKTNKFLCKRGLRLGYKM